ncbi:MAG: LPS export ABC transporter permease LptG, partial [Pseudomonadota bacterium]
RTVLLAMLMVLALMSAVDLIFSLADELTDTSDQYRPIHAVIHILLTAPTGIYELLPYAALGGALIGLGLLASHGELIVMRAAGVSTMRIVWAVMKPTLLIMLLSLVLGEWVAPQLEQRAQSQRALLESGGEAIATSQGEWRKVDNEYIHINAIAPGGRELVGITRYVFNDARELQMASFAARAQYRESDDRGAWWQLVDVRESHFTDEGVEVREVAGDRWEIDLSPELLSVLLVRPDRQSISGLYRFARFFESQGVESASYFLAFWKKLLQPLSTAGLVLLAVAFIFGPLREATMGYRVFVAITIGLAFTIVERMMGPTILLYGFSPVLAVVWPIILSAGVGLFLLRRV